MRIKKSFVKHVKDTNLKFTQSQHDQRKELMREVRNEFILLYEETRGTNVDIESLWEMAVTEITKRRIYPLVAKGKK